MGNIHLKVRNCAKIRNRYIKVPHLTQGTNCKVTNSQLDTTDESQEVSPFPAGDHTAQINRRTQRHSKQKTKNINDPQKNNRHDTVINMKLGPVTKGDMSFKEKVYGRTHDARRTTYGDRSQ